jgi:pilus assembly protein FimV
MNRPLKLSIMFALAVGSAHVAAQSLGQVQVKSALDQPLLAEIPVISESGSDTAHLEVALASEEAYSHAGVNRAGLPADLQLVVTANAQGQKVIRITSTAPISDTYLDILVELRTGKANAVREVTMLLDPPSARAAAPTSGVASRRGSAASSTAAPASTSVPAIPAPAPAPAPTRHTETAAAPTPAPAPAPAPAPVSKAPAAADGNYGPVQRGQTLSSIARKASSGADVNQMLLALKKANPDAFYRDNVNALKTGAVLRIPSADDVQAQTAVAALAEVRRQNEEWRGSAARSPSVVADSAATEKVSEPAPKSTPKTDRLALVPAKDGGQSASTRAGVAGGKGDTSLAGLRQELTSSEEALSALKQQGDELKSRVGDLEDINQKNQRLLSLKDAEIAELQQKLAELQKSSGASAAGVAAAPSAAPAKTDIASPPAAPVPAPASPTLVAATPPASATAGAVVTAPLKDSAAVAVPPVAKPVAPKPAPAAHPVVAQEDAEPWYTQPWAWAVGAGGVVVLLLLALAGRRKKKAIAPLAAGPSLADRFGESSPMNEYDDEHGMDADQRELLDELSEHPDDVGLHLELVSLYYSRRDVEHFEAAAEAMYAHIGDAQHAEWAEVVRMGEDLVPNHPLFRSTPLAPQTDDEHGALEQFDLDSYATGTDHPSTGEPSVPPPLPKRNSEYHFNFDLSPEYADVVKPTVIVNGETPLEHRSAPIDHLESFTATDDYPQTPHEPVSAPAPVIEPANEPESIWHFEEPEFADETHAGGDQEETFSDDPADTKLDLARAYLDMGDADGARAMLDEVIAEGTQMQKDVARRMLENMA